MQKESMMQRSHLIIIINPRTALWIMIATLVISVAVKLNSETMTMVASYPSPMGVYKLLTSTGPTNLATKGGAVTIGRDATSTPASLSVNGVMTLGSGPCSTANPLTIANSLQYVAPGSLQYCDGTNWQPLAGPRQGFRPGATWGTYPMSAGATPDAAPIYTNNTAYLWQINFTIHADETPGGCANIHVYIKNYGGAAAEVGHAVSCVAGSETVWTSVLPPGSSLILVNTRTSGSDNDTATLFGAALR
jgi:hypothetical protein